MLLCVGVGPHYAELLQFTQRASFVSLFPSLPQRALGKNAEELVPSAVAFLSALERL